MSVLSGASPGPLFAMRTLLRVIGTSNLSLLTPEAEFQRVIDAARQGERVAL